MIKLSLQIMLRIIRGRRFSNYGVKYIYDKEDAYCALPTKEELCKATQKFTSGYFNLFNSIDDNSEKIKIYDHIIWPAQIDEFQECFDDNFKIIIVDRDPRDIYMLDKEIWRNSGKVVSKSHFPRDIEKFSIEWKKTIIKNLKILMQ